MFFFRVLYTPSQIRYMTQYQEDWRLYLIISNSAIKIIKIGTSLVVQWLIVCSSSAEGTGLIPGRGPKIPHAAWHGKRRQKDQIWSRIQSVKSDRNSSYSIVKLEGIWNTTLIIIFTNKFSYRIYWMFSWNLNKNFILIIYLNILIKCPT